MASAAANSSALSATRTTTGFLGSIESGGVLSDGDEQLVGGELLQGLVDDRHPEPEVVAFVALLHLELELG